MYLHPSVVTGTRCHIASWNPSSFYLFYHRHHHLHLQHLPSLSTSPIANRNPCDKIAKMNRTTSPKLSSTVQTRSINQFSASNEVKSIHCPVYPRIIITIIISIFIFSSCFVSIVPLPLGFWHHLFRLFIFVNYRTATVTFYCHLHHQAVKHSVNYRVPFTLSPYSAWLLHRLSYYFSVRCIAMYPIRSPPWRR